MQVLHQRILHTIAEETEQSPHVITSTAMHVEAVDARHIYIKLLHESGLYTKQIAALCGVSVRTVNKVLTCFDERVRQSAPMRVCVAKIRNRLRTELETARR